MLELTQPSSESALKPDTNQLPISSIVRALCQAANSGPDLLYEVMVKLCLLVESTAPMFGLSTWTLEAGQKPRLQWAEGLEEADLESAEKVVSETLAIADAEWPRVKAGDLSVCFILASTKSGSPGAALYGQCVRPLTTQQARDLGAIMDVTKLAHSHVAVGRALQQHSTQREKTALPGMIFASKSMNEVARSVAKIKDSNSTVLINGESGTGKELIAHAIHRLSRRSANPFIPFNCSAAPPELIESLLFGHRKGSFTGATND
ncbi:MAG TPA: sigma 54-interacting transcriptional regulator, partial [Pyrinomonadaceae bacterium]|nr:sigma 54-interacting transcriptional regulator [Pyrinomonadaceae bacterium]